MTELVSGANLHVKYNYSPNQNNGRILSQNDVISGETVSYTYDTLNRLVQASATGDPTGAWSQAFSYDGFGNLTQKTGSNAPNNQFLATNPLTNQLTANGAQYDANGNLKAYGTGSFAVSYSYDSENRLTTAAPGGTSQTVYGYDPSNQRVYQGSYITATSTYSNEQIYFYGVDNQKLVAYNLQSSGSTVTLTAAQTKIWFAGRLLTPEDRLESQGKYFPYGEDRYNPNPANPANDGEKFATYTRDSATGLDYAYQRYYAASNANVGTGRFITPDPSQESARLADPQSWNRYSYSTGDPVNNYDPSGLNPCENNTGCLAGIPGCLANMQRCQAAGFVSDPFQGILGYDSFRYTNIPSVYGPPEGPYRGVAATAIVLPGQSGGGGGAPPPQKPPSPDCNGQAKQMNDLVNAVRGSNASDPKGIAQLFNQLRGMRGATLAGHVEKFQGMQRQLQKAIQKFKGDNCGDPPSGIADWASKPLPNDIQQRYDDYTNPKPATFWQILSHGPMMSAHPIMHLGW